MSQKSSDGCAATRMSTTLVMPRQFCLKPLLLRCVGGLQCNLSLSSKRFAVRERTSLRQDACNTKVHLAADTGERDGTCPGPRRHALQARCVCDQRAAQSQRAALPIPSGPDARRLRHKDGGCCHRSGRHFHAQGGRFALLSHAVNLSSRGLFRFVADNFQWYTNLLFESPGPVFD